MNTESEPEVAPPVPEKPRSMVARKTKDLTKRTFIEECAGCGHWFLSDRSTDSCQCPKCKRL